MRKLDTCKNCGNNLYVYGVKTLYRSGCWFGLSPAYLCSRCHLLYEPRWHRHTEKKVHIKGVDTIRDSVAVIQDHEDTFIGQGAYSIKGNILVHSEDQLETPTRGFY